MVGVSSCMFLIFVLVCVGEPHRKRSIYLGKAYIYIYASNSLSLSSHLITIGYP